MSDNTRWYFVCRCGAKWFAPLARQRCPRCGCPARSHEQMVPPWLPLTKESLNDPTPRNDK